MNVTADALSRPPRADQGEDDNQQVTMLPPSKFIQATTTEEPTPTEEQKRTIMTLVHDHRTAGHPGRDETIRKARQHKLWPGMSQWIADYVKGCATCQQNKIITHKKKTPMYRITTKPDALPFQQVVMDLITHQENGKFLNAAYIS
jgi:hypothetical protein